MGFYFTVYAPATDKAHRRVGFSKLNETLKINELIMHVEEYRKVQNTSRQRPSLSEKLSVFIKERSSKSIKVERKRSSIKRVDKLSNDIIGSLMDIVGDFKKQSYFVYKDEKVSGGSWSKRDNNRSNVNKQVVLPLRRPSNRETGRQIKINGFSKYKRDSDRIAAWRAFSRSMIFARPDIKTLEKCLELYKRTETLFPGEIIFAPFKKSTFGNRLEPAEGANYSLSIERCLLSANSTELLGETAFWGVLIPKGFKKLNILFKTLSTSLSEHSKKVYVPLRISKSPFRIDDKTRSDKKHIQKPNVSHILPNTADINGLYKEAFLQLQNEIVSEIYHSSLPIAQFNDLHPEPIPLPKEFLPTNSLKSAMNHITPNYAFCGNLDPVEWILRVVFNFKNESRSAS